VALATGNFGLFKLALTIAVLVFVRHQANIRRLLAGQEPRVGRRKTGTA
jgi:glycerol-3-phosphate acyltransferase PlsY